MRCGRVPADRREPWTASACALQGTSPQGRVYGVSAGTRPERGDDDRLAHALDSDASASPLMLTLPRAARYSSRRCLAPTRLYASRNGMPSFATSSLASAAA